MSRPKNPHASALGKLGKNKPKKIAPEESARRRKWMRELNERKKNK